MATLREREDELFGRWKGHRHGFLCDGAGREFDQEPIRVVYLLKEAVGNIDGEEAAWDLRDFIDDGGRRWTWNNIARWTAFVLDGAPWSGVVDMPLQKRAPLIRRITGLNLKKVPGASVSDMRVIHRFAMEDSQWIREQLSLYKPHLIVACGTFCVAEPLLGYSEANRVQLEAGTCHVSEEWGVLLNFWHPQARISPKNLFDSFVARVGQLRALEKLP